MENARRGAEGEGVKAGLFSRGNRPSHAAPASRWELRDFVAGIALFAATAAVVFWQNAHLVVLWDLSYVLDTAARIAAGQMPYRDFPLAHAPLTFLIQAALIRLTGRAFLHSVVYAAAVGGLGTVLAWRIALHTLRGRVAASWWIALLLAAPLTVLGVYCILPHPSYDCDCAVSILVALLLLERAAMDGGNRIAPYFAAGAALALPVFFKQNIGLPLLAAAGAVVAALMAAELLHRATGSSLKQLAALAGGTGLALGGAACLIACTAGLGNYLHWTIRFAAQRRMPGLGAMLGVYSDPGLAWMLGCVAAVVALVRSRPGSRTWAAVLGWALLAAPFAWTLLSLIRYDDADERGDALLSLWPLLLVASAVLTAWNLRRGLSLRTLAPAIVLGTVNGTMMSQQLWGSTYAIWPLLVVLAAEMFVFLAEPGRSGKPRRRLPLAVAITLSLTLWICGGFYTASEERLSYTNMPDGPVQHASAAALRGMSARGNYLPELDELLRFAAAEIPRQDGVILLPGEDPFYFATGRTPQFPVLLFDPATQPYAPEELARLVRARNIGWMVVKRDLQIKEDPTPEREETMQALGREFSLYRRLKGYDVYRRVRKTE